ncbi:hypothetical protein BH23PLA1_BH23PLA1_31520 [soil metagenome]
MIDENKPDPPGESGEEASGAGGLRTDFFLAGLADLARMDLIEGPRYFPMVPARRADPLTIADLDTALTGVPERLPLVIREAGAEGPWVALLDEQFCQSLAHADRPTRKAVADRWADSEGWEAGIGPPEDLPTLLDDLADLCRRAMAEEKKVFVWIAT